MGRGRSKKGSKLAFNGMVDANSFSEFVRANKDNPDAKAFVKANGMDGLREAWLDRQKQREQYHELSKEEAIRAVTDAIPASVMDAWFTEANSDVKPKLIEAIASKPGTLNAGLSIAYHNYLDTDPANPMPYEKWIRTPQTLYRGDRGQATVKSDVFLSYTPDRKVAESFGSHITTVRVKPIDTWGSYHTDGEQEFLIPIKAKKKK